MIKSIKSFLKKTFVYRWFVYYLNYDTLKIKRAADKKALSEWEAKGRPTPPPHIYKTRTIKKYAAKYHINTLIETGTYLGDTVEACKNYFQKIISFELNHNLAERAKDRFAKDSNILICEGDSGALLKDILSSITEPCLFWLDGHYSEGITSKGDLNTPILNELENIFKHPVHKHVILIDDASAFIGKNDYPSVMELQNIINTYNPNYKIDIRDNIIRLHC